MTSKSYPRFHKNNVKVDIIFVLYMLKTTVKMTFKSGLRYILTMAKFRFIFSETKVDSRYKSNLYIVSEFCQGKVTEQTLLRSRLDTLGCSLRRANEARTQVQIGLR